MGSHSHSYSNTKCDNRTSVWSKINFCTMGKRTNFWKLSFDFCLNAVKCAHVPVHTRIMVFKMQNMIRTFPPIHPSIYSKVLSEWIMEFEISIEKHRGQAHCQTRNQSPVVTLRPQQGNFWLQLAMSRGGWVGGPSVMTERPRISKRGPRKD